MTTTPRRGGRGARPRVDAARRAAYDTLRAVAERDSYANLVLPPLLRDRGLDARDAAFTTELVYGTLRMRGLYDAVLAECLDRPADALDPGVVEVLLLGTHQLLAMRVPAHAAVGETVTLARSVVGAGTSGLVNAVLRKVAGRTREEWIARVAPDPDVDRVGYLAVATSHPRWIVSALSDALGAPDELLALLEADNVPAPVTLVARPGRIQVADLIERGAEPGRWSPLAAVWTGDPASVPEVTDGRAGVQDEGSQLVALALADVDVHNDEGRWLDLCAGPGGKAALLAGLAAAKGGSLTAVEPREHRARLVEAALRTAPGEHHVLVADARTLPASMPGYDRVLVDAPCTGLGALRRRPESRWRRRPSDIATLRPLQRALLDHALDLVRPGGVVAYVTCSPHIAETRQIVDEVLAGRADVERLRAADHVPVMPGAASGADVQLWPHRHGTDAMFLALLRRLPVADVPPSART